MERAAPTDELLGAVAGELANQIDSSLQDPDAQMALLSSAYQYLCSEEYELALPQFESLFGVLSSDPAVNHGLRLAAQKTQRFDLEAKATKELAQQAEDNRQAATLWERAGVLHETELEDGEAAEECYLAALARRPGSPLSFDRVYRFARARGDRVRQVELIDARLETADSESLRIELLWEKARFCRMLGRRGGALRALDTLLTLAPDHLASWHSPPSCTW